MTDLGKQLKAIWTASIERHFKDTLSDDFVKFCPYSENYLADFTLGASEQEYPWNSLMNDPVTVRFSIVEENGTFTAYWPRYYFSANPTESHLCWETTYFDAMIANHSDNRIQLSSLDEVREYLDSVFKDAANKLKEYLDEGKLSKAQADLSYQIGDKLRA